jgi:hypothetical protein
MRIMKKREKVLHIADKDKKTISEEMNLIGSAISDMVRILNAGKITVSVKASRNGTPNNIVWEVEK